MAAPPDPLVTHLGDRYRFERELGQGGMATVYLARDLKHDRLVAVKTLRPEIAASLGRQRFLREIQIASQLSHPHILPLYDSGDADGLLFYVMPYVEGESLRDLLRRDGRLSLDLAVRLAREMADALGYAHEHGIIHRDMKPENILLQGGHAVVSDFGIARAVSEASSEGVDQASLTATGVMLGTPLYMSPEQILGEPLDARSDVYSLGCVLHEMLTGATPFTAPSAQGVLAAHATLAPPSPREKRPEIPAEIERTVLAALAKAPAERIQSAEAFSASLTDGRPSLPKRGRRRWLAPASALLAVVATAAVAAKVWMRVPARGAATSVAVIPFVNQSSSADDQYAADGMTDELIGALGAIPGLRVASRNSVYALRDAHLDSPALAGRLHSGVLIEGSFQRADSQLRVTAQLIDGRTDSVLWTRTLRRTQKELFALQEELAQSLAVELRGRFAIRTPAVIRRGTVNVEAYDAYSKGRYLWEQRDRGPGVLRQAAGYFEDAIKLDSTFARAWAGLADVYSMLPAFGDVAPAEAFPKARGAARRAIELDETLAEGHTSLAIVSVFYDWDWPLADREFTRAVALDSADARTHLFRAWYYVPVGDYESALRSLLTAQRLDPTSPIIGARLGGMYAYMRRYDDAEKVLHAALELDSTNVGARSELLRVLVAQRRYDEALATPPVPIELRSGYGGAPLVVLYGRAGRTAQARSLQHKMEQLARVRYISPEALAIASLGLGDTTQALAMLERGLKDRAFFMPFIGADPIYEPLFESPRYQRILSEMRIARFGMSPAKR
jgi:TolB-like protein/tRNA A-37 threonylcarbamoyl transferase component Bud32